MPHGLNTWLVRSSLSTTAAGYGLLKRLNHAMFLVGPCISVSSSLPPYGHALSLIRSFDIAGYMEPVYEDKRRRAMEKRLGANDPDPAETSYMGAMASGADYGADRPSSAAPTGDDGDAAASDTHVDLQLRHPQHGTWPCQVKKTNTLKALLRHYLKSHAIDVDKVDWSKSQMRFDDEPLDLKSKIQDLEVEDEDLIDVVLHMKA